MNDPVYQRLREIAWRRKLTPAEEVELRAWLAAHPEAAAECELDFALSDALDKLPDAPVPSNFTARVLQGIEREVKRPSPAPRGRQWIWSFLLPRAALTMLVVSGIIFGYQQHRSGQRRDVSQMRDSLVAIAGVPSLPKTDVLEDFDVIQKLDAESVADGELLALFQ